MKSCPMCNRTYSDDTLNFCLVDGSILSSAPSDSPGTLRIPEPPPTSPQTAPTEYSGSQSLRDTIESPGAWGPYQPTPAAQPVAGTPPRRRRTGLWLLAFAGLFLVIFGAGLAILLTQVKWFSGGDNSSANVQEKDPAGSNDNRAPANKSATNANTQTTTNTQASANSPRPTPTPTPEATPAPVLNIVGTWTGTYTVDPGTLTISSQNGDSVSGTLNSGGFLIAISGRVNPTTRSITWSETKILKHTTTKYANWALGVNNGTISSDGKKMSGKGKAKGQAGYSWSFSRK